MRLICYPTSDPGPKIVAASVQRHWMDHSPNRFAYRCLPLNIANCHGWLILNHRPFVASWDGGAGLNAISIQECGTGEPLLASSHFGSGVLTFSIPGLFRTDPEFDLIVTGPFNSFKDGIQPVTGVVEADWLPFTFTMNWKFTRAGHAVAFERDEPFCMIFPVQRGVLETVEPEIRSLQSDPQLQRAYATFAESRKTFNDELQKPSSQARVQGWQKDYFVGKTPSASAPDSHRTKLKLREFRVKE